MQEAFAPFPEKWHGSFDRIMAPYVIGYTNNETKLNIFLAEALKCLKPGGELVACCPNLSSDKELGDIRWGVVRPKAEGALVVSGQVPPNGIPSYAKLYDTKACKEKEFKECEPTLTLTLSYWQETYIRDKLAAMGFSVELIDPLVALPSSDIEAHIGQVATGFDYSGILKGVDRSSFFYFKATNKMTK